jgi:hypothetical protein
MPALFPRRFVEESVDRDQDREMYLVPELCRKSPVPASLWLQFLLIPSAHHRMDKFYKAVELRDDIGIGADGE